MKNKTAGQWKAHGRYLARESATDLENSKGVAYGRLGTGIDIARELQRWQASGDERMWKLIVSPEFGDRVDQNRLVRSLIRKMETDLGTDLDWIAVEHYNTEHPHVHIAIRGVRSDGEPLLFNRDYVKHGIRAITEDHCTRQLGYRTELDAVEAERREITADRFTSLDRNILRRAVMPAGQTGSSSLTIATKPVNPQLSDSARIRERHVASRLAALHRMGLAESVGPNVWRVRDDLGDALRAIARTRDRQRTLAAHGSLMSDERLPIEILDLSQLNAVEGRILVHGQDEQSGRNYLMLEGTDAKVHLIQYTPEMEESRSQGGLRTNSFVRFRKKLVNAPPNLEITDYGNADELVTNRRLMAEKARELLRRGVIPVEDGWGGWLGRYQSALSSAGTELAETRERRGKSRGR